MIKPSGVLFEALTPENMAIVDLDGNIIAATHGPSTDTCSHLAMQIGQVEEMPAEEIAAHFDRYQHRYGTFAASKK